MTKNSEPIHTYRIPGGINTGIEYGLDVEGLLACTDMGLNLERWMIGDYSPKFQEQVIALRRLKIMLEAHSQAAATPKVPKGRTFKGKRNWQ